MTRVIVVTSGKGGTGKTTTSASLAIGLALRGHKTVAIDFDVGLRNLDQALGCDRRVVFDLSNVLDGEASLKDALIRDKRSDNLYVLAASQTRDKNSLTKAGLAKIINELSELGYEYLICDSPPGIERGARLCLYLADEAIVVVTPDRWSVRDADRVVGLLQTESRRASNSAEPVVEHLLINRYDPARVDDGDMLSHQDIVATLALDLLGVIPESTAVLKACNTGHPVLLETGSDASRALQGVIARLLGETTAAEPTAPAESKTIEPPTGKLFDKLLGR